MGRIFDAMTRYFEQSGWTFGEVQDNPDVVMLGFAVGDKEWTCFAQAREPQQQFVFYSVLPFSIDEARRGAAMEFVTRANYGMILGNFELDLNDGEVRFKTAIDAEGSELTPTLLQPAVHANLAMLARYFPGFMALNLGQATVIDALVACEAAS